MRCQLEEHIFQPRQRRAPFGEDEDDDDARRHADASMTDFDIARAGARSGLAGAAARPSKRFRGRGRGCGRCRRGRGFGSPPPSLANFTPSPPLLDTERCAARYSAYQTSPAAASSSPRHDFSTIIDDVTNTGKRSKPVI